MPITRRPAPRHAMVIQHRVHKRQAVVNILPMELLSEIFRIGLDDYAPHDLRMTKYQLNLL